ncbi:hypothetical protein KIN34_03995 [Cellulomonas sp. DKR-3]|uniref:YbaB/EbfC DNA-binding family protein n=1 Tax=Cellulomonas fulva TaxID=2835530 RepID=A0ABS5TWD5_9CELL|nr:hypothetical protein [Cellulomonas fulva]MBT0993446.1 hypothetical protein [Cellulomonas fulva]
MSHPHGAVRTAALVPGSRALSPDLPPDLSPDLDAVVAATLRPLQHVRAALPAETSAWDPERLVCVSVDPRGVPVGIRVIDGWQHRAAPAGLGEAVTSAAGAAGRALDERARLAFERAVGTDVAATGPTGDGPWGSVAPPATTSGGVRRSLDEVAEDAIASLTAVNQALAQGADVPAATGVGVALDGEVEVRVGAGGLVGCTLRGMRVAAASGLALSALLTEAARAARADLERRLTLAAPPQEAQEALLAEVFAYLTAPESGSGADRTSHGGPA